MAIYVYPATFTKDDNGYSVNFPDLEGCYTAGEDMQEALYMASDVLALTLYQLESEGAEIPKASQLSEIETDANTFVNYVRADTLNYQKKFNNKAIKKTLSIPQWLNEEAEKQNLSFSKILQEALKEALNV